MVIPPSPHLHRLSKQLKNYSEHSVLLRRGDGEETYAASDGEKEVMREERKPLPNDAEQGDRPKLAPDVYDRKIAIYRITRGLLVHVLREGTIKDISLVLKFGFDTDEAIFLFDKKLSIIFGRFIWNLFVYMGFIKK
jgi:hypothetical protein